MQIHLAWIKGITLALKTGVFEFSPNSNCAGSSSAAAAMLHQHLKSAIEGALLGDDPHVGPLEMAQKCAPAVYLI